MPIPLKKFTWSKRDRTLVAEASDLRDFPLGQTIKIESHVTKSVREFTFSKTNRDREGDVTSQEWVGHGLLVIVLND